MVNEEYVFFTKLQVITLLLALVASLLCTQEMCFYSSLSIAYFFNEEYEGVPENVY